MDDKKFLDEFVKKVQHAYASIRPKSEQLQKEAGKYLPGGDTRTVAFFKPFPSFIERGEGCRLFDVDGHAYLDFGNNQTSMIHGHAHPKIVEAVSEQIRRTSAVSAPVEHQYKLGKIICERLPSAEKVRFCNSGTEATMGAIRRMAPSIRLVSAERSRDELVRILTEGRARRGMELLDSSGLLAHLLPEVLAMKGVEQPREYHPEGDVWTHTLLMLDRLESPSTTLAMGVLLHDVGKPPTFRVAERIRFDGHMEAGARMAVGIMERLRFSSREIRTVESLVADHLRFKDVRRMRESTLRRFLRQPYFEELLELHRLDCLASHGKLDQYEFVCARRRELPPETLRPRRLITGHDLLAAGYPAGPAFARMLEAVEDAQLESRISTPEEGLGLVREQFGPPPGECPESPVGG